MRSGSYFSVSGNILSDWYYVERFFTCFNIEIKLDNFVNGRSLFIDGNNIDFVDVNHKI